MTCATHSLPSGALCGAPRMPRLVDRARRRLGWRIAAVLALALAAYGEGWLLRDAPRAAPELAVATCAAALALDVPQPVAGCTIASQGSTR